MHGFEHVCFRIFPGFKFVGCFDSPLMEMSISGMESREFICGSGTESRDSSFYRLTFEQ